MIPCLVRGLLSDSFPRGGRSLLLPLALASSMVSSAKSFVTLRSSSRHNIPSNPSFHRKTTNLFSSNSNSNSKSNSSASSPPPPPPSPTTLESVHELAEHLAAQNFRKIVLVVGAGASVSAGIPDFRSPGTGLYDQLQDYHLPYPEAIFDLDYYTETTPAPFVDLAQAIWPGQTGGPQPTPTHRFMRLLQKKGMLSRIYTQNIDGLEALAGVTEDRLVEAHGHFRSASCTNRDCREPMDAQDCYEAMVERKEAPQCTKCGSLVKPDIVFFGEELPQRFQDWIENDTSNCDLLLVIGTSLLVMPVAGIPSWVPRTCPRVLINRDLVGDFRYTVNSNNKESRDLFLEGDCDDSVQTICKLAAWEQDLDDVYSNP